MKTRIPFIGAAYAFENASLSVQDTVNYYLDVSNDQREPVALRGVPGMSTFSTVSGGGPVRALGRSTIISGTQLYAVVNAKFGITDSLGVFTQLGTVASGAGRMYIRESRGYIILADAPFDVINGYTVFPSTVTAAYTYDKGTSVFAEITDPSFGGHEIDTFFSSALDNPNSYNAQAFTSSTTRFNVVTAIAVTKQRVVVFGTEIIEFYYFSADISAIFPFVRQEGATIELGCIAPDSITNLDGDIYFLAKDNKVYRLNGFEPIPISTPPINEHIESFVSRTNARGFGYHWKGHKFYNLVIDPSDSSAKTFVYDSEVPAPLNWSRRKSEGINFWRGTSATEAYGKVFIGDYTSGIIWQLDSSIYTEGSASLEAVRTGHYTDNQGKTFKIGRFELGFLQNATSLDADPGVFLSYTKDGGNTFASERERKFSDTRIIWANNGVSHDSIAFRARITARRNRDIVSATAGFYPGGDH